MPAISFRAKMKVVGVNPYVVVSVVRARTLKSDWRKPMPVLVRINGMPKDAWRINMMPMGNGSYYLYLAEVVRKASRTKVGDTVHVEVEFDSDYRSGPTHPMPPSLDSALATNDVAKAAWDKLIPSRQKEVLRYFAQLKSDEAIQRNVDRLLHVLSGNEDRFMARTWRNGT